MKWLSIHIGGQRWSVHLVSPRSKHLVDHTTELAADERSVGRCDFATCRIFIAKDIDEQAREDTLLHELLHALLHVTHAEDAYGASPEVDEDIVNALTPALHRLLKDLGFRFPKGIWT